MTHQTPSTLNLFQAAENLKALENDEHNLNVLITSILEQIEKSYNSLHYDDFMRMLVATERIADHLCKLNSTKYNDFALQFCELQCTQKLLIPQLENPQHLFSASFLSTLLHLVQKLDAEFYSKFENSKNQLYLPVVQGLQLPHYFETMHEDAIYNKPGLDESKSKAKIFVPQAEKLWKIVTKILSTTPNFPKEILPDIFLLIGEYTAQYPCSWSSESIIASIGEIKKVFSKPPITPSSVLGEHIPHIISKATKKKQMISSIAASWCVLQIEYPDLNLHPTILQLCIDAIEKPDIKMKETGFMTLSHVIKNVNAVGISEFQQQINTILSSWVTSREIPILKHALPLMLLFLQTLKKHSPIPQQTLDPLFSSFLLGINNTIPEISSAHIRAFPALLDLAGVNSIAYAAVVFPFLEGMLSVTTVETLDKATLQDLLLMLKSAVSNCWPRVHVYKYQIFQTALSGLVGRGEKCEESVVALVNDIIGMLKSCCGEEFKEFEILVGEMKTVYPVTNKLTL